MNSLESLRNISSRSMQTTVKAVQNELRSVGGCLQVLEGFGACSCSIRRALNFVRLAIDQELVAGVGGGRRRVGRGEPLELEIVALGRFGAVAAEPELIGDLVARLALRLGQLQREEQEERGEHQQEDEKHERSDEVLCKGMCSRLVMFVWSVVSTNVLVHNRVAVAEQSSEMVFGRRREGRMRECASGNASASGSVSVRQVERWRQAAYDEVEERE